MVNFSELYDKSYKKLLVIPISLVLFSILFLTYFYFQNGDIIYKDVSLTGGTTISLFDKLDSQELESILSDEISDLEVRTLSNNKGEQTQVIIVVPEDKTNRAIELIEEFLGHPLNSENSSKETTSAALSSNFYRQLISSVVIAFFGMSMVFFLIFGKGKKLKTLVVILNLVLWALLGRIITSSHLGVLGFTFIFLIAGFLIFLYIKNSIPSFLVMSNAFSTLVVTLAIVNLIGLRLSTAGVATFLMLLGYSVDTDILVITRVLQRKHSVNREIFNAFKTGITMSITSIIAVATALIVAYSFQSVLNQIFLILMIGLSGDILVTGLFTTSMIKWYVERK